MLKLLDTNACEFVPVAEACSGDYVTIDSVLSELRAWERAEEQYAKFDQNARTHRLGFQVAQRMDHDRLISELGVFQVSLDEFIEMFDVYDSAMAIREHFEANDDLVYHPDVPNVLKKVGGLLTKTIAYDVCKANPQRSEHYLVKEGMEEFQRRARKILGRGIDDHRKKQRMVSKVQRIYNACQQSDNPRRTIERFRNGIKTDLQLVACAFEHEIPHIVSDDLDLLELTDYVNIMYQNKLGLPVKVIRPRRAYMKSA